MAGQYCLLLAVGIGICLSVIRLTRASFYVYLTPEAIRYMQIIPTFCASVSGAYQMLTCDCRLEAGGGLAEEVMSSIHAREERTYLNSTRKFYEL